MASDFDYVVTVLDRHGKICSVYGPFPDQDYADKFGRECDVPAYHVSILQHPQSLRLDRRLSDRQQRQAKKARRKKQAANEWPEHLPELPAKPLPPPEPANQAVCRSYAMRRLEARRRRSGHLALLFCQQCGVQHGMAVRRTGKGHYVHPSSPSMKRCYACQLAEMTPDEQAAAKTRWAEIWRWATKQPLPKELQV